MSKIPPPPKRTENAKLAALKFDVEPKAKPVSGVTAASAATLTPLNFKVSPEFRRKLKMYAIEHDTTMVEVMVNTLNQLMDDN